MARNIFQQQVTPEKPKVLAQERIYVYMPSATNEGKGMVSLNQRDFHSPNGHASLKWPMEMMVETLADPTVRPSYTKVLSDEFVNTNVPVKLTNPVTGAEYISSKAEIKLKRENRNAFLRPELVMLNSGDFEATKDGLYNSYKIKRQDPLVTPTIIQVDSTDFKNDNNIVKVNWPYAHSGIGQGLVKVQPNSGGSLRFNEDNYLQVDVNKVKENLGRYIEAKPTYGETNIANWANKDNFIDPDTGLAKRAADGSVLLDISKYSVGLGKLKNIDFSERTYDQFSTPMKQHFTNQFGLKLDKTTWNNMFNDWQPPTDDRNTVQRWFMRLEEEDNSIWASIRTMRLSLGYFNTVVELREAYEANATLFGGFAFVVETTTYWAIRPISDTRYQFKYRDNTGLSSITDQVEGDRAVNINNGIEHVWFEGTWAEDGVHPEAWEWFNTLVEDVDFYDLVETDVASLQPNAPVANVSVGRSGKWIQSDHIHPSDPTKLDAWLIEDTIINITSEAPNENDFQVAIAKVTVLDDQLTEITASIVTTPQYLSQIQNPQLNDLAITRNNGRIFEYNGTEWIWTTKVGTITYNTTSNVNIPFVRTTQFLHNWKNSPTMFQQDESSNEYYWAGTREEFDDLNLDDIPNGAFLHVTDAEDAHLEPGHFVMEHQLDNAGIKVTSEDFISTERLVTINRSLVLDGILTTITSTDIVPGVQGERREVVPMSFNTANGAPATNHKMAIIVPAANELGWKLDRRTFTPNRLLLSDDNGNIETDANNFHINNIVLTSASSEEVTLASNRLVISTGDRTIGYMDTGATANRPVVTNGEDGVEVLGLTEGRMVKVDTNGAIEETTWIEKNTILTGLGTEEVTLAPGKVLISGGDVLGNNTIITWPSGGAEGSIIVRGAEEGSIKVRSNTLNRLLRTGPNGTFIEVDAGVSGQYLTSGGPDTIPTWTNGPASYVNRPQTKLTVNPTEVEASTFGGLVAVVLDAEPTVFRNNCIYYY